MNLTEFLVARIAEDEAAAERAVRRNQFGDVTSWHPYRHQVVEADLPRGCVAVPAPGFLAECDAKRRIVALNICTACAVECQPCNHQDETMRLLALPFADHPDYDGSWRP